MTGLSLFSGIGGLDLAFESAGGKVAAMCEIDPFCRRVLRKHWPDVPIFEDIKTLRGEDIGTVDIIFGGFPCQPFSVAGRRESIKDKRHLWPEFSRLVAEIRPVWVVAENVPGILKLAGDIVCTDLERLGYNVGIFNFEAAAVGAPHRRARVFFVGYAERGGLSGLPRGWARQEFADGCTDVPNPAISRRHAPPTTESREHQESKSERQAGRSCCAVSDPDGEQCKEQRRSLADEQEFSTTGRSGRRGAESRLGGVVARLPDWLDEPDIPRVARGVPDRVNRLKALGNAVVPAQAEPIFRAIMEAKHNERT